MAHAGKRSCLVTVKRYATPTHDPDVDPEDACDQVVKTIWGAITPLRGTESFTAAQMGSAVTHRVSLDFYDAEGITADMYLDYEGRHFDIEAILRDEITKRDVSLTVVERTYGSR